MRAGDLGFASRSLRAAVLSALVGLPASCAGEVVSGGSFTLVGGPVSGGGSLGGGGLVLDTAAGEMAPGSFQGGDLELIGTLYGEVEAVIDGVTVTIRDLGNGRVQIDWPAAAVGYVLESAKGLDESTTWQRVVPGPAGNSHTLEAANFSQQYFRLRKP